MTEKDVKHQKHYDRGGIQPIEFMLMSFTHEEFRGFLKGNIIKYTSRSAYKNGVEDLKKAKVYLDWLIDFEQHDREMTLFPERVEQAAKDLEIPSAPPIGSIKIPPIKAPHMQPFKAPKIRREWNCGDDQ